MIEKKGYAAANDWLRRPNLSSVPEIAVSLPYRPVALNSVGIYLVIDIDTQGYNAIFEPNVSQTMFQPSAKLRGLPAHCL